MVEFAYRAATADGQHVNGCISASGRAAAMRQLRQQGLVPISVQAGSEATVAAATFPSQAPKRDARGSARMRPQDVLSFTHDLAVMLRAGLPLDRALRVQAQMTDRTALRALLGSVTDAVKSGRGLSQALQPYQPVFGDFYLSMLRSGEAAGQLADVLTRLVEHLEQVKALRDSVVSALIYPAILTVVSVLSVALMLGFVVPQFQSLFDDMGDALPLATRWVIALGDVIGAWWWLGLLVTAALVAGLRHWFATPGGRAARDTLLLRLPIFGALLARYDMTRFARSMGVMLLNGVPIVGALRIAAGTVSNRTLQQALEGLPAQIKQGGRLAEALATSGLFNPMAINMVRLGEETGRLDTMLLDLARIMDDEVRAGIKRGLTLIEPLLILTLGVLIAAIIVALLLGIMSVNNLAL